MAVAALGASAKRMDYWSRSASASAIPVAAAGSSPRDCGCQLAVAAISVAVVVAGQTAGMHLDSVHTHTDYSGYQRQSVVVESCSALVSNSAAAAGNWFGRSQWVELVGIHFGSQSADSEIRWVDFETQWVVNRHCLDSQ